MGRELTLKEAPERDPAGDGERADTLAADRDSDTELSAAHDSEEELRRRFRFGAGCSCRQEAEAGAARRSGWASSSRQTARRSHRCAPEGAATAHTDAASVRRGGSSATETAADLASAGNVCSGVEARGGAGGGGPGGGSAR